MSKSFRSILLAFVSLMLLAGFSLPKVLAQHVRAEDSGNSESGDGQVQSDDQNTQDENGDSQGQDEVETESANEIQHAHDLAQQGTLDRMQLRQRVCALRQQAVTHRAGVLNTALSRHLALFDAIYARVKNFVSASGIAVSNYDQLVAGVDAAQVAAKDAVNAVGNQTPELNCSHDDNRQDVINFRSNLHDGIKALKTYLTELKDFVQAVRTVAEAQNGGQSE